MRVGSLRIGGIFSLCSLLTDTLVDFSVKFPGIKVKMVCKSGRRLFEMLQNNELDFALTFESPVKDDLLDSIELFHSPLSVIVHKNHPLAKLDKISLNSLRGYSLALPERGMHVRDILEERFPDIMQNLKVQLELNDVNILYQLINTNHWISIMPQSTERDDENLRAVKLNESNTDVQAALYCRKGSYYRNAAKVFIEMLQKSLSENVAIYFLKNKI
ncbi:MAG: LysR family transcriptional regulator substrate-binding protein [Bacteroidota bacterium]|nr:LysR family transcriptional regulator substrate-binding protein [Bacteroidota bacterium]MDP4206525.1 LysR family transcriptional regulator substrate-binding protein [Bacteroidota bacterium]